MAKEILLSSERSIKSITNISDNVAGKYILSSLREAQEVTFRQIIGDCLLDKLKQLLVPDPETHALPIDAAENGAYKLLLDKAQYYLAYQTIVELCNKVTYKIGNFGVTKSSDENLQVAPRDELVGQVAYYQGKADAHCYQLQTWLLENVSDFPELRDCDCSRLKSNLLSAATCGVWLGGPRGKSLRRGRR